MWTSTWSTPLWYAWDISPESNDRPRSGWFAFDTTIHFFVPDSSPPRRAQKCVVHGFHVHCCTYPSDLRLRRQLHGPKVPPGPKRGDTQCVHLSRCISPPDRANVGHRLRDGLRSYGHRLCSDYLLVAYSCGPDFVYYK